MGVDCLIPLSLYKFEEMNSELEENRELADNRQTELQKLQQDLQNVLQENTSMKVISLNCTVFYINILACMLVFWYPVPFMHSLADTLCSEPTLF